MDRAEQVGLGVAAAGHVALFALLSATFLVPKTDRPLPPTMDVSLVDQVALDAAAPAATEAPAASRAPELGPPEDTAEPTPAEPAPEPVPLAPQPKAAPPPKPAPVAKPQPKQSAAASPDRAKAPARPAAAAARTRLAAAQTRPRGGSLGDVMKGIVAESEPTARGTTPRAARLDATALAGIQDAIRRQIQPCADRQVDPGPGANQISTTLNLRFTADGTLSATPTVVRQSGADGENARYKQRVVDLGIAALRACSPLRLPPEFYRTAAGGWSNINFIWKLR